MFSLIPGLRSGWRLLLPN